VSVEEPSLVAMAFFYIAISLLRLILSKASRIRIRLVITDKRYRVPGSPIAVSVDISHLQ
jgi:hypothetical protein